MKEFFMFGATPTVASTGAAFYFNTAAPIVFWLIALGFLSLIVYVIKETE